MKGTAAPARSTAARRDALRGAGVTALGGGVAVGFGAAAVVWPVSLVAIVAVPLVLFVALVPVAIATLADGIAFPLLLIGRTPTLVNLAVLGACLLGLPAVLWRRRANVYVVRYVMGIVALALPGITAALLTLPKSQVLSGARYLLIPLLVAIIGSSLDDRRIRLLLKGVTLLSAVSALAAGIETALGSDGLLRLTHLSYGVSIRNIGSALRAPGTFATNYHLGAYSAVVAVIALLWWGGLDGARKDIVWRAVALLSSLASLAFSTYRTGVILLVVSVIAALFLSGKAIKRWVKVSVAVLGVGVALGFVAIGLGNTQSLFQRLDVWSLLLSGAPQFLGHGIGFAGAASGAAGSARQIFTDNYYISLWLNFGVPGLLIAVLFIAAFVVLIRQGRRGNARAATAAALVAGALVAFAFVELWEYTSAMSLITLVAASSVARPSSQNPSDRNTP